jgi:hypothetical protein
MLLRAAIDPGTGIRMRLGMIALSTSRRLAASVLEREAARSES